jgi:PEP-CTERM motif
MTTTPHATLISAIGHRLLALGLMAWCTATSAATLDEAVNGDLSNDRLTPTLFTLDPPTGGVTNTLSGRSGRVAGVVDRDYIHIVVPTGYLWTALNVGNITTGGGGGGSFIGLASGNTMPVLPTATDATGLLGWKLYGAGDRGTDILDDLAVPNNGSSGFGRPLPAGSYTLWIQELATGDFPYSFNLTVTAVPEPASALLMLLGLSGAVAAARRARRC